MRDHGPRFECLRLRPHDHMGWIFAGSCGFAPIAVPFLAEGAALGERLMYVAAGPGPAAQPRWPGWSGWSVRTGFRSPASRRRTGPPELSTRPASAPRSPALSLMPWLNGYSGIRVAADNTPLVSDEARLAAWIRWEIVADRLMSENQVTGLCAFDREKVDLDRLRHLATLHPLSSSAIPVPQFRMFADSGNLCVEGEVDSFAVSQLWLALESLPPKTGVLVDLAAASLRSHAVLAGLRRLCNAGVDVTIRGDQAAIGELAASGQLAGEPAILQADGSHGVVCGPAIS